MPSLYFEPNKLPVSYSFPLYAIRILGGNTLEMILLVLLKALLLLLLHLVDRKTLFDLLVIESFKANTFLLLSDSDIANNDNIKDKVIIIKINFIIGFRIPFYFNIFIA
jgi:hypothetical protein